MRVQLAEQYCQIAVDWLEWTHIDNGQRSGSTIARKIAGGVAKRMGTKKGFPDYIFVWETDCPHIGFIEFKTPEGSLSKEQREFRDKCLTSKFIKWELARSADQGMNILRKWGIITNPII